jgi:hypothetical protein
LLSWSLTDDAGVRGASLFLFFFVRTHVLDLPPTICSFEKADFFHSTEYSFMRMYILLVSCASLFLQLAFRVPSRPTQHSITNHFSIMSPIQKIKMAWKAYKNKKRDEKLDKAYTLRRTKSFP